MRRLLKPIGLLLLLLIAQQGAVVHELSHLTGWFQAEVQVGAGHHVDTTCTLCPAFAQVVIPACSHPYPTLHIARATPGRHSESRYAAFDAAPPRPRSRGPPSLS